MSSVPAVVGGQYDDRDGETSRIDEFVCEGKRSSLF